MTISTRGNLLWLACNPNADAESITMMLHQAQRDLGFRQNIKLEHPAGLQEAAIQAADFVISRTLVWMYAGCNLSALFRIY